MFLKAVLSLTMIGYWDTATWGAEQASKSAAENRQPVYMRTTPTRAHIAHGSRDNEDIIVDVQFEDVDISYNGKKWFHLLGNFCLKQLRFLQVGFAEAKNEWAVP